jgi:hypothetical protein
VNHSTLAALLLATPFANDLFPLADTLVPLLQHLGQLINQFRSQPVTPAATAAFERDLSDRTRQLGQAVLDWVFNHLEPDDPADSPARVTCDGQVYRRRDRHPKTVATLFGPVRLWRLLYEPLEPGERSAHPLEQALGLEAGCATPALAERAGLWAAQQPQRAVLAVLRRDHGVCWSQETLRKVIASLRDGLEPRRHDAQCRRVLDWLRQAQRSRGPHRPVLAAGRDGIHVPLRRGLYREGAVARLVSWHCRGVKFFMPNPCRRKRREMADQRQRRECRLWTAWRARRNRWSRSERLAC